ncbi:prepilin peptidase [Paenibacillus sp. NPDC058174]|uniref:A24 family peptidase n=1 Tax=Paenibacillus sp. NPDC058174 TaxID=3346366 RepID=UPI0036D92EE6
MPIPITIPFAAAAMLLAAALYTDVRSMLIPNRLTLSFFAAAIVYRLIDGGWHGLLQGALGAAAGFVPLLLLYAAKGIGAGDVKLFGALGAWIGVPTVLYALMYAILYAGAIGLIIVLLQQPMAKRMISAALTFLLQGGRLHRGQWTAWAEGGRSFPFMLAAVPGAITAFLN